MTNLLVAIKNIIKNDKFDLNLIYRNSTNRINNSGDSLELFAKDAFCDSFNKKISEKEEVWASELSYIGNKNNPPDFIIKNSDAIEIKKIEKIKSAIALNSSFPKNKLFSSDPRITKSCVKCETEEWETKDLIYTIGVCNKSKLNLIWFIYGDCYCADKEVYEKISNKISQGILEIPEIEWEKTNELGKIKKIDPLGITDLRVRGMWHIENPIKVFENHISKYPIMESNIIALIPKNKYESFPKNDRTNLENLVELGLKIQDIKIKSPNNPAKYLETKLIFYAK